MEDLYQETHTLDREILRKQKSLTGMYEGPSSCCFGFLTSRKSEKKKKSSKKKLLEPKYTEPWQMVFEEYIPKFSTNAGSSKKIMIQSVEKMKKFQKEFEISSYNIYNQNKNQTTQNNLPNCLIDIEVENVENGKTRNGWYFEKTRRFSRQSISQEEEEAMLHEMEQQQQKLKNMINTNLEDHQVKIYYEIENQCLQKGHPVQLLSSSFSQAFSKQYQQYISKDMQNDDQLLEKIIQKTVGLQSEYVFKMADQFNKVEDRKILQELQRKREITLGNSAIDDIKVFFSAMQRFIFMVYGEFVEKQDIQSISEDIAKMIVNFLVKDDVYKVLICLLRIDNFHIDKDLRLKYATLKGVKTTDFGIDPYLCMSDPLVLIKEASKKYGVNLSKDNAIDNTTVQNLDTDDNVNIEFKEFLKNNNELLNAFPSEIRQQIISKAKIRPFKKSVLMFRENILKPISPLSKLFLLQDLKTQIQEEINEFWGDLINDKSKLILNRDEQTSILLFIICKSEIPDLISQIKLMQEFTSEDIQEAIDGYYISDTYSLFYTTVQWLSCLEQEKLADKSYLIKANVEIREDRIKTRYDKIKIGDGSDRFDPFTGSAPVRNSYIEERSFRGSRW